MPSFSLPPFLHSLVTLQYAPTTLPLVTFGLNSIPLAFHRFRHYVPWASSGNTSLTNASLRQGTLNHDFTHDRFTHDSSRA